MTEAIEPMKQFKLYVPPSLKSYTENDDGTLTIEGIASTTNKDLQGDIILPSAIDSMKKQLLTTTKNLHGDHHYGLDGIYGAIKEVLESDEHTLKIKAVIRKSKVAEIKEMLDIGVNLGLSIGGKITEYTIFDDGWEIKDLRLMEISLTGMPANWDTYGTITESVDKEIVEAKCLSGACHVIRKNLKMDDKMPEEDIKIKEDTGEANSEFLTEDDVVKLFNELKANMQDEIARETIDQVSKELRNIVQEEVKKLTETNPDEGDNGEDTDKDNTPAPEEEDDEEKEKALVELINATVKNAMDENLGKLFKELGNNREPTFHADKVKEQDLDPDEDETEKGLTSKEIAEKMFSGDSKDSLIRSLLG